MTVKDDVKQATENLRNSLNETVKDTKENVKSNNTKLPSFSDWVESYNPYVRYGSNKQPEYPTETNSAVFEGLKRALNVTTDIGKNLFTLPSVAIGESQIAGVSQKEWDTYMGMQAKKKQAAALRRKLEITKTNPDTEAALRQQLAEAETVTPEEQELSVAKSYDTKERKLIPTASRPQYAELVTKRQENRYIDRGSIYDRIDSFIAQKNYQQKVDEFVEKNLKSEVDNFRMQELNENLAAVYKNALGVDEATGEAKNLCKTINEPKYEYYRYFKCSSCWWFRSISREPRSSHRIRYRVYSLHSYCYGITTINYCSKRLR